MRLIVLAALAAVAITGCSSAASQPDATPSTIEAAPESTLAPDEALVAATRAGNAEAVAAALAAGADPNVDMGRGVSALSAAVQHDDIAMVETLLSAGAAVDALDRDGRTPLIFAASAAGPEVIEALIAANANTEVFTTDVYNISAIHAAAQACNPDAIPALAASGIDIDMVNEDYGATALHAAAWWDCPQAAVALVEVGAQVNPRAQDGATPLALARDRGADDVVTYLESIGAHE